jgi:D-3-phosphoglycerate dehydrogenase / 2-oxoglutarate reductase
MRAVFIDATPEHAGILARRRKPDDLPIAINQRPDIKPEEVPASLAGAEIALIDHTYLPTDIARQCQGLRHIVFLGTGARSYMKPEELAELGIEVHLIRGYGDTAVAEMAMGLAFSAAKRIPEMNSEIRRGQWVSREGMQLTGKTLGIVGYGGIGAEMARLGRGIGMSVLAWNRTPRNVPGVTFCGLEYLLRESDVVSLHLSLTPDTRHIVSREGLAQMKPGAILVNTARGALVDEDALADALLDGDLSAAALDVFEQEPLPTGNCFSSIPNVVLTAHAANMTSEAGHNLIDAALDHCRQIVENSKGVRRTASVRHPWL